MLKNVRFNLVSGPLLLWESTLLQGNRTLGSSNPRAEALVQRLDLHEAAKRVASPPVRCGTAGPSV